jgi:HK97 family phage portal protein
MKTLFPPAIKRVSVSEDGTYAVGPSTTAIQTYLSMVAAPAHGEGALGIVTVYACVRVLAETIASLPLILYRRLPGGGKERATDHPLYETFHDEPNPDMTSLIWRELLVSHVAGWGNHFSEMTRDGLNRLQFWPIRPDRVEAKFEDGRRVYDYLSPTGERTRFLDGTIFHVRGLSSDGLVGYSPIALHRKAIQLYATAQEYGTSFLANGARPAVVMTHPGTLSQPAIDRLANQMDAMRGSRNAGKTVILEEGLTIQEVGIAPEDAQYIETRKFQMQEIARMYRVPPHMIGDLERATFSNIEHQSIDFVVHTIRPWLVRIEQEIKSQVLAKMGEDELFVEFLVDGLLRGDAKSRAEALATMRQNGIINGDEWRAIENLNPISDELGKTYWMPVNYGPATPPEVEEEPVPEAIEGPPQLRVVKSMAQFDCPDCGRMINRLAAPGTVGHCKSCKAEKTFPHPAKASNAELLTGLSDAIRSVAEPPVVNVAAPIVNIEAAPPPDVHVHTDSFVDAIDDLKTMLAAPRSKRIERDANGRIVGLVEA